MLYAIRAPKKDRPMASSSKLLQSFKAIVCSCTHISHPAILPHPPQILVTLAASPNLPNKHTQILCLGSPKPLQLRPLHKKPIHHPRKQIPTQARPLDPSPALHINRAHLTPSTTPPKIKKPQHHRSTDNHNSSRRPITKNQIRHIVCICLTLTTPFALPLNRHKPHQHFQTRNKTPYTTHRRGIKRLVDLPRAGQSLQTPTARPDIRGFPHLSRHQTLLPLFRQPSSELLELLGPGSGNGVTRPRDPSAMAVVAPVEAKFRVFGWRGEGAGWVDGFVQHAEHLGCVAAAAEEEKEMRGLVGVAAAVADGFVACVAGGALVAEDEEGEGEKKEGGEEEEGEEGHWFCGGGLEGLGSLGSVVVLLLVAAGGLLE